MTDKTDDMLLHLAANGVSAEGLEVIDEDILLSGEMQAADFVQAGENSDGTQKEPSYGGDAYTGGIVTQPGFKHPIVVDVKGVRYAKDPQVSLYGHDSNDPVGHHTPFILQDSLRVENGRFSVPGFSRDKVVSAARAQFPWQMSIRGRMEKMRFLAQGKKEVINARTFVGPLFVVDSFLWRETTFTGLGADQGSPEATIAAAAALGKGAIMSEETKQAEEKAAAELAASEKVAADKAAADKVVADAAELAASEKAAADLLAAAEAEAAEIVTAAELAASEKAAAELAAAELAATAATKSAELVAYQAGQERIATIEGVFGTDAVYASLKASAIKDEWDTARCESEMKAMVEAHKAPDGFVGRECEKTMNMQDVLSCSMAIEAGVPADDSGLESYSEDVRNMAASAEYRGQSWHSIIHLAAQASGRSLGFNCGGDSIMKAAAEIDTVHSLQRASGQLAASGGQGWSTLDIGSLTVDVLNKVLYSRFNMYPSIMDKICDVGNAKDMRPHYKYRLEGGGFMENLAANGEITHKNFAQTSFQNSVGTKATMVSAPRTAIINDDLGVFRQIGEEFGRGAAKTLERDVITALFAALSWDGTNQTTGAGSAFGVTALDAAMDLYSNLNDTDGTPIDVQPSILLVQSGSMYRQAVSLLNGGQVQLADGITKTTLAENTQAGIVDTIIHTPWLKNPTVTGYSTTAWFLLPNPRELPVLEALFLNGKRTPTIERGDSTFNTLGAQWRAYWDYGIGSVNDTGIVRNVGA